MPVRHTAINVEFDAVNATQPELLKYEVID